MLTKDQFDFTMNAIVMGVMNSLNTAFVNGQLTEVEAQAGAERIFSNLAEMITPNWQEAFSMFMEKIQQEVENGEKEPGQTGAG